MNLIEVYTASVLLLMIVLLTLDRLEIELVFFGSLILLLLGNVISVKEAFAGFSNEGMLTIAFLFVVAGSLHTTGALRYFSERLFGSQNASLRTVLSRVVVPVTALSAFMNNTPIVAILIPAVRSWTSRNNISISKLLLPISYAAILGGMCTLIGTSTNLIVHGLLIENGIRGFDFFEISKIGIPVALIGLAYLLLWGHRFLPSRKEPMLELTEKTRDYVAEMKVTPAYQHIGKSIQEAGLRHLKGLYLFQIERRGKIIAPVTPEEVILRGDRLFFTGVPKTILELQQTPGLQVLKDSHFDLKHYDSKEIKPYEAVISHSSPLIGQNAREANFRGNYEAVIIAIHRNGERIKKKIGDIVFRAGDTLLLLAGKEFKDRWYMSKDFYLISETDEISSRPKRQVFVAITTLLAMILVAALKILPLITAAAIAAMILVLSGSVTRRDVMELIDWRVLVVISSAFGVASAIRNSGLADRLAAWLLSLTGESHVLFGVLGLFVITGLFNILITSNATAALMFPIALALAQKLQVDPHAFALALTIAAAASFMSPLSYQTNLMVYGPGGYKPKDYLKIGIPLQLLVMAVGIGALAYFYF